VTRRRPPKPLLIALAIGQTISAAFAWRDLSRRPDAQVRGPKRLWRTVMIMNPGNSIAYWAFGRRR
jgi:hypothetical protein